MDETKRNEIVKVIDGYVEAVRLLKQGIDDDCVVRMINSTITGAPPEIHLWGLRTAAEALGLEVLSNLWDGNKTCKSNYNIIYFYYGSVKFFELEDREDTDEQ